MSVANNGSAAYNNSSNYQLGVPTADMYANQSQQEQNANNAAYNWGQTGLNNNATSNQQYQDNWNTLWNQNQARTNQYSGMVDSLWGTTAEDTQNRANQLAQNNPYTQQAIDQSWANVNKNLGIAVGGNGGVNDTAASSGNMNSSRAGVVEGLARAEAANTGQQNELAYRQNAYNNALNTVQQNQANQLNLAQSYAPDQAAGMNLLSNSMGQQQLQNGLQSQYLDAMKTGGQGMTQNAQTDLDNIYGRWNNQWGALGNLYNILGGNNWGQTGTTTVNSNTYGNSNSKSSGSNVGFGLSFF